MKIIFNKIRYKNFLSTGNVFTEIDLSGNPTTLVCGENGSGKSTFMDALCFSLYGKPFRKVNKPQLVNSVNAKTCVVEVEFNVGTHAYKIVRGLKPNLFEIYMNGNLLSQNADNKDYQEILEKNILRMNYKTFCQIVILGSANFVPFMQLAAQSKREFIEDLLDIQVFSNMNNILKEKINTNKEALALCENDLRLINSNLDLIRKHAAEQRQNVQDFIESKRFVIDKAQKENNDLLEQNQILADEVSGLQEKITKREALQKNNLKMNAAIHQIVSKIQAGRNRIKFYEENDSCPTCSQTIDDEFKKNFTEGKLKSIEENESLLVEVKEKQSKISQALDAIDEILDRITGCNQKMSSHSQVIASNNRLINMMQKEIASMNEKIEVQDDSEYKKQLVVLENKKEELIKQRELFAMAAILLKDTGIKARIIKQYIPVLNKLINRYLEQMDFFCQFEMDESFEEKIKSRYRDEFSYESFSEGEKMRINLSMLFAWREISRMRNSSATNLLILDEVMDGSLDVNGMEEFLKIVVQLAKANNIFIISHKTDQISDKFAKSIKFEKVKNFSRVIE